MLLGVLLFFSPRFARLFWRIFEAGPHWQWGLIELGYFNTMRITRMSEHSVRFRPRLDNVTTDDFHTHGLELMYVEIEEMFTDTETDSDGY